MARNAERWQAKSTCEPLLRVSHDATPGQLLHVERCAQARHLENSPRFVESISAGEG